MNPRILAAVLAVGVAGLIVACGGDGSKDSTSTTAASTASVLTTVPSVSPPTASASTGTAGDFCSRIPTDATASVAGASAESVSIGDLATVIAGRRPSSVTTPLAACRYRSDAGLLTVSAIPVTAYDAIIAVNPGLTHQAVSGVGDAATLLIANGSAPFDVDGRTYTAQVLLLAKAADKAVSISVLTTGHVSTVDVEPLKGLARTLLQ